jgi:thymidylate synthase (FAD)
MNFTDTTLKDDTHRYIVSANLRGWIEFFNFCVEERFIRYYAPYLQDIAEIIKNETRGIVDYTPSFLELGDLNFYGVSLITDFSKLSYSERMIHETFTVLFSVDRGVTHEVVRMRDSSFAQESTRYCNYSQGRFGGEIIYVKPVGYDWWEEGKKACWLSAMANAEWSYLELTTGYGESAQIARGILPHNVKADIVVTTNLNEWRHIFELRACDKTGPAHPQMKEVMCPLCAEMQEKYSFAFGDLEVKFLNDGK